MGGGEGEWGPTAPSVAAGRGVTVPSNSSTADQGCAFNCPTVCEYPDAWPLWVLVFLYACNGVASVAVLFRKKQGKSWFRNLFLYLQCFLCLLRTVTFTARFPGEDKQIFLLLFVTYTLPIFIQFVTFSLLTVFLIKCLLTIQEKAHLVNTVLYPVYAGVIIALAAASGVSTYLAARGAKDTSDPNQTYGIDYGLTYYAGITFGLLTFCVAVTGFKTHRMLLRIVLSEARQRQVMGVSYVVAMYCCVFCGRTAWSITYIFNKNPLQAKMNTWEAENQTHEFYIGTLCFYIAFEILPTIYLLRCFWMWLRPQVSKQPYSSHLHSSVEVKSLLNSSPQRASRR